ncbi:hypothetical protein FHG64_18000 [Antarcticibacterium flavum]|uniref:Uncharacterized protein n=1 Tax=Antarcticibacterium flavum TaxID=2058175 RepID=A0A5B7X6T5_9FLAO|nr:MULTISPECIES: hypothetical protein [Antarcticibacterium]MCM4160915.1 hypothetical protein [Antarcticibacterium sp. W02-3]QCY71137.1 hypothetical protein FHG64_18000 [Antarcticibacterium flavum]
MISLFFSFLSVFISNLSAETNFIDCCKLDLSPFQIVEEVYIGQDKKFLIEELKKAKDHYIDDLNYEVFEIKERTEVFGEEKIVKKTFSLLENQLHYVDVEFPVEVNEFLDIVESLKNHNGFNFINSDFKYFFRKEQEKCEIFFKINSTANGYIFMLRMFSK